MRHLAVINMLALGHASVAAAQDILEVPSGLPVTLHDVVTDQPGQTIRFRFVAPDIIVRSDPIDYLELENDLAHLCREIALPRIASHATQPDQIVISLSDRSTEFGVADPEATQYFEGYSIDGDDCQWEPF